MSEAWVARSAVMRSGLLLAGGLLGVAASGHGSGTLEKCLDPGWAKAANGALQVTCAPLPGDRWGDGEHAEDLLFSTPLDLNRASAGALEALPSIGPRRAQAIVETRRQKLFSEVSELTRVHGIGPRTLEDIRAWVVVRPRSWAGGGEANP